MSKAANPIRDSERLGRRVSDDQGKPPRRLTRLLKQIGAGNSIPYQEFLSPEKLPAQISVDRLDEAGSGREMAEIALRDAQSAGKIFHGWAWVSARAAFEMNREVRPSPVPRPNPNPYHADIIIPGGKEAAIHSRRMHAETLAENAKWLEWREREKSRPNFRVV